MTLIDGIILAILVMSSILGFARGITREILSLASWASAGTLTYVGMHYVKDISRQFIANQLMADGAAIVGLFLCLIIIFNIVSHVLSGLIRGSLLGGIDRSLGSLFGVIRGILLLCAFQLAISIFLPLNKYPEIIRSNRFFPVIYQGSETLLQFIPENIKGYVQEQQHKQNSQDKNGQQLTSSQVTHEYINEQTTKAASELAKGIVENVVKQHVPQVPPQQLQQNAPQSLKNKNIKPSNELIQKAQAEAEQLARLQPKINVDGADSTDSTGMTVKQEKALDKFLNATDIVDAPQDNPSPPPSPSQVQPIQQNQIKTKH